LLNLELLKLASAFLGGKWESEVDPMNDLDHLVLASFHARAILPMKPEEVMSSVIHYSRVSRAMEAVMALFGFTSIGRTGVATAFLYPMTICMLHGNASFEVQQAANLAFRRFFKGLMFDACVSYDSARKAKTPKVEMVHDFYLASAMPAKQMSEHLALLDRSAEVQRTGSVNGSSARAFSMEPMAVPLPMTCGTVSSSVLSNAASFAAPQYACMPPQLPIAAAPPPGVGMRMMGKVWDLSKVYNAMVELTKLKGTVLPAQPCFHSFLGKCTGQSCPGKGPNCPNICHEIWGGEDPLSAQQKEALYCGACKQY
jgi:hypothetical protein